MELNKQDFEHYLRSMDPGEIAGYRMKPERCPLATWSGFHIGPGGVIRIDEGPEAPAHYIEMSAWVARFVQYVDGTLPIDGPSEVTVAECLQFLTKIEED